MGETENNFIKLYCQNINREVTPSNCIKLILVSGFCEIDPKKIGTSVVINHSTKHSIPIIFWKEVRPPFVVCVALNRDSQLEENIRSLTRDDLLNYIKTQYTAPRMVIAGAGAVDHAELCGLAAEHFGKLPSSPPGGVELAMEPAVFTGSDYRYVYQWYLQHVVICVVVLECRSSLYFFQNVQCQVQLGGCCLHGSCLSYCLMDI